ERPDQFALCILDGYKQPHEFDVDLDGLGFPDTDRGANRERRGGYDRAFVTESSHSPSTHTSPSAKYSFFQIGTSFFSRLMPSSAASNAGLRCGALAATTTLASPISRRPNR